MVKHNNAVPRNHFHKDWQRFVKTWFNQPARAERRRVKRKDKAARLAPRPVGALRPIVRCPTVKYNSRVRAGKGFSYDELRAAGVNPKAARGVGIAVDKRRKNRSEESLQRNVERLKAYMSKLVIFPTTRAQREAAKRKNKPIEAASKYEQVSLAEALPIQPYERKEVEVRKISKQERDASAFGVARKALIDEKYWGRREARAKKKATEAAAKGGKAKDEDQE